MCVKLAGMVLSRTYPAGCKYRWVFKQDQSKKAARFEIGLLELGSAWDDTTVLGYMRVVYERTKGGHLCSGTGSVFVPRYLSTRSSAESNAK